MRGLLSIRQETDQARRRVTLVARVQPREGEGPPPLYDVTLIACTGEIWTLAGYEWTEAGALQHEHCYGQSWLVEPAQTDDVIRAEREWAKAAARVAELEAMVKVP